MVSFKSSLANVVAIDSRDNEALSDFPEYRDKLCFMRT